MSRDVRVYARVTGRVQGVGFRFFVERRAQALGLVGYVRNLPGGEVELEAEGPEDRVSDLIDAVGKGPPMGFVTHVVTDARPVDAASSRFDIRY